MALYSKSDLDIEGNDGTTLRDHIEHSEDEFGLTPIDLDKISDERLTEYVDYIYHLRVTGWHDCLEDRKGW